MTSTDVKPTLSSTISRLASSRKNLGVKDILGAITEWVADRDRAQTVVRGGDTAVPQTYIGMSTDDTATLDTTLAELDGVRLPNKARTLTEAELRQYVPLLKRTSALAKVLVDAEKNLKLAFNNHFNREVEAEGKVDGSTPTDSHGNWWVKADTSEISDLDDKVVRDIVNGSPGFDVEAITALFQAKEISSTVYGRITRQVREVNEVGLAAEVARDPKLADLLQGAVYDTKARSVRISVKRNGA